MRNRLICDKSLTAWAQASSSLWSQVYTLLGDCAKNLDGFPFESNKFANENVLAFLLSNPKKVMKCRPGDGWSFDFWTASPEEVESTVEPGLMTTRQKFWKKNIFSNENS